MDETNEGVLLTVLSLTGLCAPSRLDDVGVDVQLGSWLIDLGDEDVDLAEWDPVPILDLVGLGAPS
jgi:hypothetical protein